MLSFSLKKYKKSILILLTVLVILSIGGVSAFLTTNSEKDNAITIGEVKTEITEDYTPPKKLEPGISFKKKVSIKNTGPNDCYVRVLVEFSDSSVGDLCTLDYNTNDWTYNNKDHYWYYNTILKSGETTKSLFNIVKISDNCVKDDLIDFDILIYHESSSVKFK